MDPFHSLDNLKSQSASVSFYRSSKAYSGRSGAVTDCPVASRQIDFLVTDRWWSIV